MNDPIKRFVEHGVEELPSSPMDPPEAYKPLCDDKIPVGELAPFLQELCEEHEKYLKVLSVFDNALVSLKKNKWKMTPEISMALKEYFQFVDESVRLHNRKEERALFPILWQRLLESGECGVGDAPVTPVDIMEEEHQKVSQSMSLVFNFLGLAPRMKDTKDRDLLFEHVFGLGQEIVETMKLHIFRENTILFPMAQRLLTEDDKAKISGMIKKC
jgi:regulator of cell morphogenesis and NO signaling